MKRLLWVAALSYLLVHSAYGDDLAVLRMSQAQQHQLFSHLENTACDCGCGMTVGQCLRDDPSCPVSPELARQAIQSVLNGASTDPYDQSSEQGANGKTEINSSQNGSVVSGRVDGQNCTYASAGGYTVKHCD